MLFQTGLAQESLTLENALTLAYQNPAVQLAKAQLESSKKQLAIASAVVSAELSTGYSATFGELNAPSLSESQSLDESDFEAIRLSSTFNVLPLRT